jgi:hypothetical protein
VDYDNFLIVTDVMLVWSMMKVASLADAQREQRVMEHGWKE